MILAFLLVLLGLGLLFLGGEALVRGSSSLALRLGLTPLVVGLTIVAFGTSAPELVVSVKAAIDGLGAIAMGNVIGSNILNIGLILGVTALIYPLEVQLRILRIDTPIMIGVALIAVWVLADVTIGRVEGALLAGGLVLYTVLTVVLTRRVGAPATVDAEFSEGIPARAGSPWRDVLFVAGGLGLLVGGSHFLVEGSVSLASALGISEAVIGLTIVSAGTSTPELATSVIAAFRKQPDIALGNIIGSCIFNVLGILGIAALVQPMSGPGISMVDLWVAAGFAMALVPIMWSGFTLQRWEGAVLVAGYAGYLVWLWPK